MSSPQKSPDFKLMRARRNKIKSPSSLARTLKRKTGVVFTNGCFDIIHSGHIDLLERARKLGKILVVALNTDTSVRRLKGRGRPINSLRDRLEVIAALEAVDFVTWFGETTPLQIIEKIRPNILTKGGDWEVSKIVGASAVRSWGGRVRALPYIKGRSTTRIITRARKK